jgi:hypothetical protein
MSSSIGFRFLISGVKLEKPLGGEGYSLMRRSRRKEGISLS